MRKLPVIALAALFASQSVSTLFAQAASRGGNVTGRGQVNASAVQRALDSRAALINRVSGAARTSVGNSAAASSQTSLNASSRVNVSTGTNSRGIGVSSGVNANANASTNASLGTGVLMPLSGQATGRLSQELLNRREQLMQTRGQVQADTRIRTLLRADVASQQNGGAEIRLNRQFTIPERTPATAPALGARTRAELMAAGQAAVTTTPGERVLAARLAEIDRMRDSALARGDLETLARADQLEASARAQFESRTQQNAFGGVGSVMRTRAQAMQDTRVQSAGFFSDANEASTEFQGRTRQTIDAASNVRGPQPNIRGNARVNTRTSTTANAAGTAQSISSQSKTTTNTSTNVNAVE